jgi:hypothetical protein
VTRATQQQLNKRAWFHSRAARGSLYIPPHPLAANDTLALNRHSGKLALAPHIPYHMMVEVLRSDGLQAEMKLVSPAHRAVNLLDTVYQNPANFIHDGLTGCPWLKRL